METQTPFQPKTRPLPTLDLGFQYKFALNDLSCVHLNRNSCCKEFFNFGRSECQFDSKSVRAFENRSQW
jgi:hypothetical protein